MTMQKSFKRLVRARMEKTGESYAAARASLLAGATPKANEGPALPVSDAVMRRRTGRGWEEWLALLDAWGAADRPTADAARWARDEHRQNEWSSQAIAIGFHRARGLRAVGEGPNGFTVTASKTVGVPVERLYEAFVDVSVRGRWLPGEDLRERTVLPPRSARFDWRDGATRVNVTFWPKGDDRSAAAVQHERLPDGDEAERMKAFWRERVSALKAVLEA
jgi:uncharacterized protein YndB with AHSA1/START domain